VEQVCVRGRAGAVDDGAESLIGIGIRHSAAFIKQHAGGTGGVIAVVALGPTIGVLAVLADEVEAIGIDHLHGIGGVEFLDHLGIARQVVAVYHVAGDSTVDGLLHPVAVPVIGEAGRHARLDRLDQTVLRVIGVT